MRPYPLLACLTLLSACSGSGFYRYERDTFTLPGANPNRPTLAAPNYNLVMHDDVPRKTQVLVTDQGDIWPPPPKPIPTLKDLQAKQIATGGSVTDGLPPLAPLPSLPGYEISQPDPTRAAPEPSFAKGVARVPFGANVNTTAVVPLKDAGNGAIVVPNGNGTSTVISPTGKISTIPTPKN
jgi:hypothetical protein